MSSFLIDSCTTISDILHHLRQSLYLSSQEGWTKNNCKVFCIPKIPLSVEDHFEKYT